MILYLIRHGESIANIRKLVTGDYNDILSQRGIEQVLNLRELLNQENINGDYYITSQWARAQQTAEILFPDVQWDIDERIGETEAGNVANNKLEDFLMAYNDFYLSYTNSYPNGESHKDLNTRVLDWLDSIIKISSDATKILVVTHSGPISCILQAVKRIDMNEFPACKPNNASLTTIKFFNSQLSKAKVVSFNMAANSV